MMRLATPASATPLGVMRILLFCCLLPMGAAAQEGGDEDKPYWRDKLCPYMARIAEVATLFRDDGDSAEELEELLVSAIEEMLKDGVPGQDKYTSKGRIVIMKAMVRDTIRTTYKKPVITEPALAASALAELQADRVDKCQERMQSPAKLSAFLLYWSVR